MTKKMIAGVTAGAVLLAGGFHYVYAAQNENGRGSGQMEHMGHMGQPGRHQPPKVDKEKAAQKIAATFGVDKNEILSALNDNADFRSIGHAAMLAKVSGKSFKDVLAMKTRDNQWRDVEKSLGVTQDQLRSEMDNLFAARMAESGNVDAETAKALLKKGYLSWDIEAAAVCAKESGKSIQDVLDMKKINNRWSDVAKSLGVDEKKLRSEQWGHGGFPGGPFGRGDFRGEHPHPQMPEGR